jgi:amino acid transporter
MKEPEPLFARETSGLIRAVGAWDVFTFNVLGYALGLVLALTPTFLEQQHAGVTIQFLLIVGAIACGINGLTYACLSAAMPRSGGDYIFISRTLGLSTGFISNWGFTCSQVFGIGVYLFWCITTVMSPGLLLVGDALGSSGLVDFAKTINGPSWVTVVIGIALLGFIGTISILGLRGIKRLLTWLFLVAIAGIVVLAYVLFAHQRPDAVNSFLVFVARTGGTAPVVNDIGRIDATSGAIIGSASILTQIYRALPLGYWVFLGFTYSVYIGGEVRQAQRSQMIGIIGSVFFGLLMYWVVLSRYYTVFGTEFIRLISEPENAAKLPAGNTVLAVGGSLASGVFPRVTIALSFFLWYFLLLIVMTQICVRNLFAWAMDRLVPAAITNITSRNAAPWLATLIVTAGGIAVFLLQCWRPTAFVNYIALFSVCNCVGGIAAVLLPYLRKDLLERIPRTLRFRVLGIPLISILGAANSAIFLLILQAALTVPVFSGVDPGWGPATVLLLTYVVGAIFFIIQKRRTGLDTRVLSFTLPPE